MKFTIRDLMFVTVIVALALGWGWIGEVFGKTEIFGGIMRREPRSYHC